MVNTAVDFTNSQSASCRFCCNNNHTNSSSKTWSTCFVNRRHQQNHQQTTIMHSPSSNSSQHSQTNSCHVNGTTTTMANLNNKGAADNQIIKIINNHPSSPGNNNYHYLPTPTTTADGLVVYRHRSSSSSSILGRHHRQKRQLFHPSPLFFSFCSSWSLAVIMPFIACYLLLITSTEAAQSQADGPLSWQQVRPSCTNSTMALLNATIPFVFRSSHLQVFDNYTFSCYGFISTVYFYVHKEPTEEMTLTKPFYLDIWDRLPNKANWFRLVNSTAIYPSSAYVGWHWHTLPPAQRIPVGPGGIIGIHQESTSLEDNLISVGHYETITNAPLPMKIQNQLKNGITLTSARVAPLAQGDLADRRGYSFYLPDAKGLRLPGLFVDVTTITDEKESEKLSRILLSRTKRQTPVFIASGPNNGGSSQPNRNTNTNNNNGPEVVWFNSENNNNGDRFNNNNNNNNNNGGVSCGDPPSVPGVTLVFQSFATGPSKVGDYAYYQCPQQFGGGYAMTSCNTDGNWCCMPLCLRRSGSNGEDPAMATRTFRFTPPPGNVPPAGPGFLVQPQGEPPQLQQSQIQQYRPTPPPPPQQYQPPPQLQEYQPRDYQLQPRPQFSDLIQIRFTTPSPVAEYYQQPQQRVTVTLIPPMSQPRQQYVTPPPYLAVYEKPEATPQPVRIMMPPQQAPVMARMTTPSYRQPVSFNSGSCGTPPRVPNAIVVSTTVQRSYSQTQPGDTVEYACLPGYQPLSYTNTYTCSGTDLMWVGNVGCIPETGSRSSGPVSGSDGQPDYPDSDVFRTQTIIWMPPTTDQPISYKTGCMPPVIIENGYVYYQSFGSAQDVDIRPGDFVTYECRQGYVLVGQKTVRCTTTGWGATPMCVPQVGPGPPIPPVTVVPYYQTTQLIQTTTQPPVTCGPAPTLNNAYIIKATFDSFRLSKPGDTVEYACLPGYDLAGMSRVTACLTSGRWSELPYCIERPTTHPTTTSMTTTAARQTSCGSAPFVPNARIRYQSFQTNAMVNDIVMYDCLIGYTMSGLSTIACMSSGKWTIAPSCVPPTDAPPTGPGTSTPWPTPPWTPPWTPPPLPTTTAHPMSTKPDIPLRLMSSSVLEKMALDHLVTVEQAVASETPIDDSLASSSNEADNSAAAPSSPFALAEWQAAHLATPPDECSHPPYVDSARIVYQTYAPGTSPRAGNYVVYGCLANHRLIGPSVVWCQGAVAGWTTTPFCIVNIQFMDYPGIVMAHANPKFIDKKFPAAGCGFAPDISNARIVDQSFAGNSSRFGDYVTYECRAGFITPGSSADLSPQFSIKCLPTNSWSTLPSGCIPRATCGSAPLVSNGFVVGQSFESGNSRPDDRVQYDCQVGFRVQGTPYIICMQNGQWTPPPNCMRQDGGSCVVPPRIPNADISYTSIPAGQSAQPGHVVFYKCQNNLQMQGQGMVRCTQDGTWSTLPTCVSDSGSIVLPSVNPSPQGTGACGPPPIVPHATVVSSDYRPSRPGDFVTYTCEYGYVFDTARSYSDQIVCGPDGSWSPPPVCRPSQNTPVGPTSWPGGLSTGQTQQTGSQSGNCPDTHLVILADFQWSSFFQDSELDAAQQLLKTLPIAILAAMGRNDVPIRRMKITLSTTRISAMSASQMMANGGSSSGSGTSYGIAPASVMLNPTVSTMPSDKATWDRWVDYNVKTFLYPLSRELSSALYDVGNRLLANDTGIEVDTSGRSPNGKTARRVLVITSANRGQSIVDAYDAVRALQADVAVLAVTQYVQSPVLGRLLKNNIAVPASNFIYLDTISALKAELSPDQLGATTRNLLCL